MTAAAETVRAGEGVSLGLDHLDATVLHMFSLVQEALEGATQIFLSPDREAARAMVTR